MIESGIFVETSVQSARILLEGFEQAQLEFQIRSLSPNLYTNNYVWMEYQRTVIADHAHIHRLMRTHGGWGKVIMQFLVGQRSFRPQAALRCSTILGLLYEQSAGDISLALRLLNQALIKGLRERFWQYVAPLADGINCNLVTAGSQRQPNGFFQVAATCRREEATCHLPQFLAERSSELRTIADYLAHHPQAIKNQAKVAELLTEILRDPRSALGQTACWPLGDVIIALQIPANMRLWTRDPDFVPLAAALGIGMYQPSIAQEGTPPSTHVPS